jgi:hypothetical protein
MRWVTLAAVVLVTGGCGSAPRSASPTSTPKDEFADCVTAAPGFSICGKNPTGGRGPSRITHGAAVVAEPVEDLGRWRKVFVSPDGKTLLAEWSGACEVPTAYLIAADGGRPRAITNYANGSATSFALGWQGAKARVRLPEGEGLKVKPGIYLVDPATMAKTLVRRLRASHGC